MKLRFDNDGTLIIMPESSKDAMALRYWWSEYQQHGDKVLHVSTDIPMTLPKPQDD